MKQMRKWEAHSRLPLRRAIGRSSLVSGSNDKEASNIGMKLKETKKPQVYGMKLKEIVVDHKP